MAQSLETIDCAILGELISSGQIPEERISELMEERPDLRAWWARRAERSPSSHNRLVAAPKIRIGQGRGAAMAAMV